MAEPQARSGACTRRKYKGWKPKLGYKSGLAERKLPSSRGFGNYGLKVEGFVFMSPRGGIGYGIVCVITVRSGVIRLN